MRTQKQLRILLSLNIAGSIGLFFWWMLFPVLLPIADATDNFQQLILDANWTALNLLGLLSCLLLCLGLPGIFLVHHQQFRLAGFTGLLLAAAGLILFTAIQYYETLLWPAAAEIHPDMVRTQGVLVSGHYLVVAGLLVSGFILGAGYLLFGIAALRTKMYPPLPVWLFMLGAVVFGNGVLFPVRTVGLIIFTTGTMWLSIQIIKNLPKQTC